MLTRSLLWTIAAVCVVFGLLAPGRIQAQPKSGTIKTVIGSENQKPVEQPASTPSAPAATSNQPPQSPQAPPASPMTGERVPGAPDIRTEKLVRIVPVEEGKADKGLTHHASGDVRVEQGSFPAGNNYSIVFYRTENGTLQEYRVNVGGTKTFDCAYVQWKNETTVIVRLCNTKNQQEMRCVVSGHDGWTGVQVD